MQCRVSIFQHAFPQVQDHGDRGLPREESDEPATASVGQETGTSSRDVKRGKGTVPKATNERTDETQSLAPRRAFILGSDRISNAKKNTQEFSQRGCCMNKQNPTSKPLLL